MNLSTVEQFAKKHKAWSMGALRNLIFHANKNGMAEVEVIFRIGSKVLIDEDAFFRWIKLQNANKPLRKKGSALSGVAINRLTHIE